MAGKCSYCGYPLGHTDREDGICNSCLYVVGTNRVSLNGFMGGDNNFWNYNQTAIDKAEKELEDAEKYKQELLKPKKRKKAAK